MKNKSRVTILANSLFILAILAVASYLVSHSLKKVISELFKTSPILLFMLLLLGVGYQLIEGLLLKKMIQPQHPTFRLIDGFFASCYAAFYRVVTFGAGTILSEISFYHQKGVPYTESVGFTSLRLTIYKLSVALMAFIALFMQIPYFLAHQQIRVLIYILIGCFVTFGIAALLLALALSIHLQSWLMTLANRFIQKPIRRARIDQFNLNIYALRIVIKNVLFDYQTCGRLFAISLLKFSCWFSIPVLYFWWTATPISLVLVLTFIIFATVLAGILPAPAGIGSFEFVYLLLFQPLVGTTSAVSSMLLYRFATYVLPFLLGFCYVLGQKRQAILTELKEIKKNS